MRLVIATHNAKKAGEMVQILSPRFPELEIVTLAEYPGAPEPDEVGDTYEENAVIKAESACRHTGEWCVADDAGLEIDALGGAPGVRSKRFAGEDAPFSVKIAKILEQIAAAPTEARTARFQCRVALARPESPTEVFEGICEGRIAEAPRGTYGFGYDPIFEVGNTGRTMAEHTPDEKHAISHRGMVLAHLAARLDELLQQT